MIARADQEDLERDRRIASLHLLEGEEKPDVVDAHVALTTRATGGLVWTSDSGDIARADYVRTI